MAIWIIYGAAVAALVCGVTLLGWAVYDLGRFIGRLTGQLDQLGEEAERIRETTRRL